jgi:dinuclear metal center YbgI/SA1388 family protein
VSDLSEIVSYCDAFLRIREIGDYDNALNGLQLENSGSVKKIAAAVDFSTRTLQAAAKCSADLLIVHHGMFWTGLRRLTKAWYRQLKLALHNDIAVYSAHLPLDSHPEIGNNVLLMRAISIEDSEPFFEEKGLLLGQRALVEFPLGDIVKRFEKAVNGSVHVTAAGPQISRHVAVITGAGGSEIERLAGEGVDTFITGEAPHWAGIAAHELGINLLLGGHYATEIFGVRALADHLAKKFGRDWEFIDLPTGL